MRFTAKSYLSGGSKLCCKNVDRTKYGKPIRRSILGDRKFLQEQLQKPGQPYKTGEQQQTGRLWQAGEKNKLRRSYWSLDREKGCCAEVVKRWWIKEGRGTLFVLRKAN